jgi:hypothetical protein
MNNMYYGYVSAIDKDGKVVIKPSLAIANNVAVARELFQNKVKAEFPEPYTDHTFEFSEMLHSTIEQLFLTQ